MIKSNNNNIFTNINYYNINNADKMVVSYQVTAFYCHFLESKHNYSKVVCSNVHSFQLTIVTCQ